MKTKPLSLLPALVLMATAVPLVARDRPVDPVAAGFDALVVRPLGAAVTVVGAAVFVVAVPFAAIAKQVPQTAETLVAAPARAIFQRPLGDFTRMRNHAIKHTPSAER